MDHKNPFGLALFCGAMFFAKKRFALTNTFGLWAAKSIRGIARFVGIKLV